MAKSNYSDNVFVNCPFDCDYHELHDALVFCIHDCGFVARSALEMNDSGEVRIEKICRLIKECKYGIHDLSRVELDSQNNLPRFNMPLELGIFFGAKKFGAEEQKRKVCLILDEEKYRYQKFLSDFAGQDLKAHHNSPEILISTLRDWFVTASERKSIPGGKALHKRYQQFRRDLPTMCKKKNIRLSELTFRDYANFVAEWLNANNLLTA